MRQFVFAALLLVAAPAFAQGEVCAETPAQLRAIAGKSTDAHAARRALGYIATAEKLCEAGNDRAASKKIKLAMKVLNVDSASLTTPAAGQ